MTQAEDFQEADSSLIINSVFNAFLSYTAIMFNIITIHALRKTLSLPKPLKTLLLSLAVSDLGVGLLVQPLYVAYLVIRLKKNTENSLTIENTFSVTSYFFCCASFLGVTALTADRFLAIHLHLRYQELVTRRRVVAVVTSIWLLSASYSTVWLSNPKLYFIATCIIATVCLVLTAFFYCKIYLAVRRHKNQLQVLQVQQIGQSDEVMVNAARQMKSAVGTFYVYLVFLVCYLPFISITVVNAITGPGALIKTLFNYTWTLVWLNSSLNPLVYCWKMKRIRHTIMNVLRNMFSSGTTS